MYVQMFLNISVYPSTNSVLVIVEKWQDVWLDNMWVLDVPQGHLSWDPCQASFLQCMREMLRSLTWCWLQSQIHPLSFLLLSLWSSSIISHAILLWFPRMTTLVSWEKVIAFLSAVVNTNSTSFGNPSSLCFLTGFEVFLDLISLF